MSKLLITGCGRSGTQYMTKVLQAAGIQVGHEKEGLHGTVDWHLAVRPQGYDVVLHQVRDPLKVIASCHMIMKKSWRYISKHEPRIVNTDSLLLSCMKYWLYWNQRAEEVAVKTYRVEDIDDEVGAICNLVGFAAPPGTPKVDKTSNSRKHRHSYPDIFWEALLEEDVVLAHEVMNQATRYGYKISRKNVEKGGKAEPPGV